VEIAFRTEALRKLCNDSKVLRRKYGPECHELKGDLAGFLAVDIHKGYRIVFKPGNEPRPTKPDGGLDWVGVTAVVIERIEDYHG